jgi:5-methylcytosine-specific restriction endonuclease McrA
MKRRALSKTEREAIYNKTDGHCAYCGEAIELKAMQADHVAPIEFDGLIEKYGNDPNNIDNLLPSCRSCNYIKSSMTLEKFRQRISGWIDVLQRDSVTFRNASRFKIIIPNPHAIQFYFEQIGLDVPDYLEGLNLMYKEQK